MAKKLQFTGKFDVDKETVKYVEQDLTEVQQMQARANLGLYHSTKEPKALSRFSFSGNTTTGINLITSSSSVGTDAIIRIYGYNGHDYEVAEYTCKLESYFIPMAGRDCWYGNGKLASQDWSNYYGPSDYPFVIYKGELFKYGTGIILDESKMPFICSSYMVIILDPSNTDVIYHTIPREYLPDETDPTVPLWAKQPQKPTYTADEVGALSAETLPEAITTALAQAKASGAFDGADGITPTIGDNGNWYLGNTDTGIKAAGSDGTTPDIKIGTVETLPAGSAATASMEGTEKNPLLNLGIPQGADGKSAYQYAVEGGYTGTEAEFSAKLAEGGDEEIWETIFYTSAIDAGTAFLDIPFEKVYKKIRICTGELTFTDGVKGNLTILEAKKNGDYNFGWSNMYIFDSTEAIGSNVYTEIVPCPEMPAGYMNSLYFATTWGSVNGLMKNYRKATNTHDKNSNNVRTFERILIGSRTNGATFAGGKILVEGVPV